MGWGMLAVFFVFFFLMGKLGTTGSRALPTLSKQGLAGALLPPWMLILAAHYSNEDSRTERMKVPLNPLEGDPKRVINSAVQSRTGRSLGRMIQPTREATSKQSGMWCPSFCGREGEATTKGRMPGRLAVGEEGQICSLNKVGGMHSGHPRASEERQVIHKFKDSLNYRSRPCGQNKQ